MSNRHRISVSLLALSVIFVTAGTLSAVADNDSFTQSATRAWNGRATGSVHLPRARDTRHATSRPILAPNRNVPDDLCDLPSTGCESFLAN